MGVLYSVFPLHKDCTDWLDQEDIPYPSVSNPRLPTPRELETAIENLEAFSTPDADSELIQSTDPDRPDLYTRLIITEQGSEDEPCKFYFSKGADEVVLKVIQKVTAMCGPLVVLDDSATWPVVVCPEDSFDELLLRYRNPWPNDT